MIDEAQSNRPHKIDNREVETKRAMPRDVRLVVMTLVMIEMCCFTVTLDILARRGEQEAAWSG